MSRPSSTVFPDLHPVQLEFMGSFREMIEQTSAVTLRENVKDEINNSFALCSTNVSKLSEDIVSTFYEGGIASYLGETSRIWIRSPTPTRAAEYV